MTKTMKEIVRESDNFKKMMVFPQVVVSPELTNELLELNTNNRPVKSRVLEKYITDMATGNWKYTGDVINVSNTGILLNGQHRLMAISHSGKQQMFNIQVGLSEDTFQYMDGGANRSGGDAVSMYGFKNYHVVSSAMRTVMSYQAGELAKDIASKKKAYSVHEIVEFTLKQNADLVQDSANAGSRLANKFKVMSGSGFAALFYIFSLIHKDDAYEFLEKLSSGKATEKRDDTILLLRNKLINIAAQTRRTRTSDKFGVIIKGWNIWRQRKLIKNLIYSYEREGFPVAV